MNPRSLLVAAVILAALSGVVWWAKKHPDSGTSKSGTPTPTTPKIADIPDAQLKQIELTKKGGVPVTLQKQSGKWTITAPDTYAADQDSIASIVSALSPLNGDSVVEDKASDPAKFGLTAPTLTVAVTKNDGKTEKIEFGDDVPAGSLVYAQRVSDPKLYAVSTSVRGSFDKSLNDLRDKRLLTYDSNKLTGIELASGSANIGLGKNNQNDWQIIKPKPYRADNFQVEELLRKLSDAKMDLAGNAEDLKKADASFAAGQPIATAKISDSSGTQTLDLKKNKDDYFARSSVVKGSYKVSADLGKELAKPLDDFRNKKLYDFGFTDPTKLAIQQNGGEKVYQKSGQDWKLNGGALDPASVQAFVDKLRDLASTKFLETGFTTGTTEITVVSNDGKRTEKVQFAKNADGYLARRENEPAVYQLESKAVDDLLKTANDIKPVVVAKKK